MNGLGENGKVPAKMESLARDMRARLGDNMKKVKG
jgi:hypothetical protein